MADEGGDAGGKKGVKFDDKPMEKGGENDCFFLGVELSGSLGLLFAAQWAC